MNEKSIKIATAMAVLVAVLGFSMVVTADDADAIGEDLSAQYGEPTVIDIAPGFKWTYSPSFPEDLVQYLTVSLKVNDSNVGHVSGKTITVTIPKQAQAGTVYNVVIQAAMSQPVEQTAYQYVQFNVIEGLSVSGTINDIIKGSNIDFTPSGSSGMGDVAWKVKDGTQLPDGLSFSNGKVTGKPTAVGENKVQLTASAKGQTKDLVITFTVYSKINQTSPETIRSYGTQVSSAAIENASDIGVRWVLQNGSMPSGFTLNADTGVVSGKSTEVKESVLTIKGTSTHGPVQSVTKQITVQSEPKLVLGGGSDILTYKGNHTAVTSTVTANPVSQITWTEDSESATVDGGVVSVQNPGTAGMSQTITVTAETQYGQSASKQVTLKVEDTLAISGDASLSFIAGSFGTTSDFTVTGGSGNQLDAETSVAGLTAQMVGHALKVSSASPLKDKTVTVTVTSAAGQTASAEVSVDVFNQLVFTSAPTGGAIIYAV